MIKTYRQGDLKSGFEGIRVAVMVDGKARQKYFSFKSSQKSENEILSEAKSLHAQWLMEKNLAISKREVASKEVRRVSSPFSTGVKGIKFRISYHTCYFHVQGVSNHVRFNQNFSINKLGYDLAWFKACEYLQKNKDYSLLDTVYKNKPVEERLLITFRYLYFTNRAAIYLDALTSIIDQAVLLSWFQQLLAQYPKDKQFKNEVLNYMNKNKLDDSSILKRVV